MRMLLKVQIPTEAGNAAVRAGKLSAVIQQILADLKPEAAYFAEDEGVRTGYIFFDMQKPSDLPAVAEPWFLALNAKITVRPAMVAADLAEAASTFEKNVKAFPGA